MERGGSFRSQQNEMTGPVSPAAFLPKPYSKKVMSIYDVNAVSKKAFRIYGSHCDLVVVSVGVCHIRVRLLYSSLTDICKWLYLYP